MKSDKKITIDDIITQKPCSIGIALLKERLPKNLYYHTFEHTLDVVNEVLCFAAHDRLKPRETVLIATAAVFHDTGFTYSLLANEAIGAKIAADTIAECEGYSDGDAALVTQMILDTQVQVVDGEPRQVPTTKLSKYLLDADVSNLGREDFFEKAELVRREMGLEDEKIFFSGLLVFVDAHRWYSPAAQALRQEQKVKNVAALHKKIASLAVSNT